MLLISPLYFIPSLVTNFRSRYNSSLFIHTQLAPGSQTAQGCLPAGVIARLRDLDIPLLKAHRVEPDLEEELVRLRTTTGGLDG